MTTKKNKKIIGKGFILCIFCDFVLIRNTFDVCGQFLILSVTTMASKMRAIDRSRSGESQLWCTFLSESYFSQSQIILKSRKVKKNVRICTESLVYGIFLFFSGHQKEFIKHSCTIADISIYTSQFLLRLIYL